MTPPSYTVTLHHLSPDAKSVGVGFANEQVTAVTSAQLRMLLQAFSTVAMRLTIYEPATPEIRIKTDRSAHVVRTRHGRLCLVGWEARLRGEEHSIGHILSTVTGAQEPAKNPLESERTGSNPPIGGAGSQPPMSTASTPPFATGATETAPNGGLPRWLKITGLTALIVGFNATTVWLVFYRTGPSLAPKAESIPDFESGALLAKAAGEYETGGLEGDRRLIIEPSGNVRIAKYGPERAILQETRRTAKGATVQGRAMLVTSDPATIDIKDAGTVIYFGTTFKRRVR